MWQCLSSYQLFILCSMTDFLLEGKTLSQLKTMNKNQRTMLIAEEDKVKELKANIEKLKESLEGAYSEIAKLEERIRGGNRYNDQLKEKLENSVSKSFCLDNVRAARLELKTK